LNEGLWTLEFRSVAILPGKDSQGDGAVAKCEDLGTILRHVSRDALLHWCLLSHKAMMSRAISSQAATASSRLGLWSCEANL